MHRSAILVALLVVAGAAAQTSTQNVTPDLQQTQCWDCHAPGLWDPPMEEVGLGVRIAGDASGALLQVQVENTWRHTISDVRAVALLPSGGDWSFRAAGEPSNQTVEGTAPYDPLEDSEAWVEFEVPDGTQRLSVALDSRAMFQHDLVAELYGPGKAVHLGTLQAGSGAVHEARDIAVAGWGTYHAKVVRDSNAADIPEEAPFQLRVNTDPRTKGSMLVVEESRIEEGETLVLSWPVDAGAAADATEMPVEVTYTSYYDHPSASDPDKQDIRTTLTARLAVHNGQVALDVMEEPPQDEEAPGGGVLLGLAALGSVLALRRRS